ncbi:bifunctional 2-C-methyl-D-erythritol 4-phosphate cytidylyltransferase/2-C-methyl-D-erythritol 2,4-cyclodiphosphate synthase [Campylobacter sp. 9BO]|uniref:bifunctional 2-C-methyl-D-erythritol 4-phosphate cytidylyltransferase/2-C-methyl-D-erythritol 2,4-cyclodiphosphate synthase n=1 Tax=Campylobacter sp. 9BO TaxID=3424759 RepID=UPI003D32891D
MLDVTLIMLGAGNSTRFGLPVKKQWLRIGSDPLWLMATKNLSKFYTFKDIIIASKECEYMSKFAPHYQFIAGGETRQESLKNALQTVKSEFVLVSDIARPIITQELFSKIIDGAKQADCVIPALKISDTAYFGEDAIDREKIKLIQTPQLSRTQILKDALKTDQIFTDDSSAIRAMGGSVWQILGDEQARKITITQDLKRLNLQPPSFEQFVGTGFDVHEFADDYELWLCGEKIEHEKGLKAHSDGDVALHALSDAILGAAGLGDIGEHFPDTDEIYKGVSSVSLLQEIYKKVQNVGFELVNADITIMAEQPKLSKFKAKMETNIANALNITPSRINVKATTTEKLGFVGRKEGIAVIASASLKYFDWTRV